jgi:hypothetical protein
MERAKRTASHWVATLSVLGCAVAAGFQLEGVFSGGRDHAVITYASATQRNAIADLNAHLQDGSIKLQFSGRPGYLRSVLDALGVHVESQMLVFSKTSLQKPLISPEHPRSIFFNDSVVVAWVPGEPFIEAAAEDVQKGVIFYTLDYGLNEHPVFMRQDSCLSCHESLASMGVPGMLLRSVFPGENGTPIRPLGDFIPDDRSPFRERWGGWYVTGSSGPHKHLGNRTFANAGDDEPPAIASNLNDLDGRFDTGAYLAPYSDIVSLMVFEHQMRMVNLLTRAGWEIRLATYEGRSSGATSSMAHEIADDLLFVDEAPLSGPIKGTSGFAEKFAAQGPWDNKSRSLRQLDLTVRLMRYPCSYMIYSAAFNGLPAELKNATYRRMWEILSGQEKTPRYARLTAADRQAVLGILRETMKDLPTYFR